jgi:hypothetical protein
MSDPIKARLDDRREELMRRVALIEAACDLDEPGGEIAFAAHWGTRCGAWRHARRALVELALPRRSHVPPDD